MSTLIFGELWDAPVCEDAISVPTPTGTPCLWCKEAIEDGDRGLLMSVIRVGRRPSLLHLRRALVPVTAVG